MKVDEFSELPARKMLALALIMLLGAGYAARAIWMLYQGEYIGTHRHGPRYLLTGELGMWRSLADLFTGAGVASVAPTGFITNALFWWVAAIFCGAAALACYSMAVRV